MNKLTKTIHAQKGGLLMEQAYLISQGLEEFAAAREQFRHLVNKLQSDSTLGMEHGDVEQKEWDQWLTAQGIKRSRHRKVVTEGALMGGLLEQGIPSDLVIMSDDAGQFNIFDHALRSQV